MHAAVTADVAPARRRTVAIIGAGAAGLAALSTLRDKFDATAFEGSDRVGGVWNYSVRSDGGPMYPGLSTNLPKEVMAFPDWPWDKPDGRSFVRHDQVLEYLRSYCYCQGLEKFIRFGHSVVSVRPTGSGRVGWVVETRQSGCQTFDAVVVASGHFAKPSVPRELPGFAAFPADKLSHSSTYREPEAFSGKRVALLGAASSGQDIALELATTAKNVLLCHRGPPIQSPLPDNVIQLGPIERLYPKDCSIVCSGPNSLVVPDGFTSYTLGTYTSHHPALPYSIVLTAGSVQVPVDHVMFCTGYDYDFPFLDRTVAPIETSHVPGLYMHVAHCQQPGLYFLGLCTTIVPFPQFHLQARLIEALMEGRVKIPNGAAAENELEIKMLQMAVEREKIRNLKDLQRHLHTLGDNQWTYNDRLAELAGCGRLPPVTRLIYDHVKTERRERLRYYKQLVYRVTGPDSFDSGPVDVQ